MRKIEVIGLIVILILGIFLAFYVSNPMDTKSNYANDKLNNPLELAYVQIVQIENMVLDFFVPAQKGYTENSTASLDSIGKTSDGNWYINATAFAQYYTKYMAMSVTWYDSSGNIISNRKLVWNQSNLEAQKYYPIHIVSHMNNGETPTKVKIAYFDDPQKTDNDSKSFLKEEINNGSIVWLG